MMARWRHVVKSTPFVLIFLVIFYFSLPTWTTHRYPGNVFNRPAPGDCSQRTPKVPERQPPSQEQQPPSQSANTSVSSLVMAAISVLIRRPLLVTFINDAYIDMTTNWLCHTQHFEGLHDNLLLLAQDAATKTRLQQQWPKVAISTIPSNNTLSGALRFQTVGYIRMMVRRTELINQFLQEGISLILFETDFVWYDNPIPDFLQLAEENDLDMVGTKSAVYDQIMCGGFIYFRNRPRTRLVWQEVLRLMHYLETSLEQKGSRHQSPWRQNEQQYLNILLKNKWGGVRYGLVDYKTVVMDGQWYNKPPARRNSPRPKVVHNNFLDTIKLKMARFKQFNQWVLDDQGSCDRVKVTHLLS